jgi:hypothetical protein
MKCAVVLIHNKELSDLYGSLSVVRIVKSGLLGCAKHVARIEKAENACRIVLHFLRFSVFLI